MNESDSYKVCILAAGLGSRLGDLTRYVNKALLPVDYKPVLSHILEKFPSEIEIIIAVGYHHDLIRQFVNLCYPERNITLVQVDRFEGPNIGPGYSLLQCKEFLQSPFIVTTCDTLVLEQIPTPDTNWMGVSDAEIIENYCSVIIEQDKIAEIRYKEKIPTHDAFVGIAGVHNHERFWQSLEDNQQLISDEIQLANGLAGLIEAGLYPVEFTWFDTGDQEGLRRTQEYFGGVENLDKDSEFIYFLNDDVVKFFPESEWVSKRVQRADLLGDMCPNILNTTKNFYIYRKVEGQELSRIVDDGLCRDFLDWCKENLWERKRLGGKEAEQFNLICRRFYYDKTLDRINQFYRVTGQHDRAEVINGNQVSTLTDILNRLDWTYISRGIPSSFHGDLHFDNVLLSRDPQHEQRFCLLDWRQDFGGIIEYGDLYYDLSKMYHALTIAHEAIKTDRFNVSVKDGHVSFDFWVNNRLLSCRQILESYIIENGFDLRKVQLMTHLIFLNMSPLHPRPFNLLLYYLGKLGLHKLTVESNGA
ncbi:NTP transferase domain-containing protein [Dehalococcoidia bacterium]|nr:NTP transferase domain-containing protein [Dehalococcoidia bacterium]